MELFLGMLDLDAESNAGSDRVGGRLLAHRMDVRRARVTQGLGRFGGIVLQNSG